MLIQMENLGWLYRLQRKGVQLINQLIDDQFFSTKYVELSVCLLNLSAVKEEGLKRFVLSC